MSHRGRRIGPGKRGPARSGSGGTPAFGPASLSGLAGWWKADAGVTVDGSDNVSTWADQSGNSRDLTQATEASRPAYVTSGGGLINGLPTLHFNTGTKVLGRTNDSILQNVAGWTMFAYYRFNSTSGTAPLFSASTASSANVRARISTQANSGSSSRFTATVWRRLDADSLSSVVANTPLADNGGLYLISGRMNFASGSESSLARRNGASFTGATPGTGTTSNTASAELLIGNQSSGGGALQFYGHLGEVIVYNRALTDTELGDVETYLVGRWGAYT